MINKERLVAIKEVLMQRGKFHENYSLNCLERWFYSLKAVICWPAALKERARLEKRVRELEEVFTKVVHELKEECYECFSPQHVSWSCSPSQCRIKQAISMLDPLNKESKKLEEENES